MAASALNKEVAIEEIRKWINFIMENKGWNGSELARRAGVAPSTILRMNSAKNYNFVTSLTTIGAISEASGFKPPKSLIEAYGVKNTGFDANVTPPRQLPAPGAGMARLPLGRGRAAVAGEPSEEVVRPRLRLRNILSLPKQFHYTSEGDVFVDTPPRLMNDPTAFAFHLKETALEPVVPHGSLMYASKGRDPAPGDMVIITKGDGVSLTRIFVDHNEDGIVLRKKIDSPETVTVPMEKIEEISVIMMTERT